MWCITGVFFLIIGTVIWILEQRLNDDFRGPPSKQLVSVLWFNFSTLFTAQKLLIDESRLVPLNLPGDYARALKDGPGHGGVAAIVDDRAYVEFFLSTRCQFSILGQEFKKNGRGFKWMNGDKLESLQVGVNDIEQRDKVEENVVEGHVFEVERSYEMVSP
ncbi:hypothetical protein FXO38_08251 [Capsicum annuum]|nr:hypothetical protein FXO38_08251 [Capsicum annuum]